MTKTMISTPELLADDEVSDEEESAPAHLSQEHPVPDPEHVELG